MFRAWRVMVTLLLVGFPLGAFGQSQKADTLLVYGDSFAFWVREPSGWHGDTDVAAEAKANIVFYREGEGFEDAVAPIFVKILSKSVEDTSGDLAADMKGYRSRYPNVEFADIDLPHPKYRVSPKLFFIPGKFYEYVAYLNPGEGKPLIFSVWMSAKQPATEGDLSALRFVVKSLVLVRASGK
jgi:hypothetical protein